MAEPELLTPEHLASEWGIPKATLYAWRQRRVGPPSMRVGRHIRYRRADVEQWLDEQTDRPSHSGRGMPPAA
jgi:excisionase family DNA binding protein